MERIKKYYKLCGVKNPQTSPVPFINIAESKRISNLFHREEKYFREDEAGKQPAENVIGAGKIRKKTRFVYWDRIRMI